MEEEKDDTQRILDELSQLAHDLRLEEVKQAEVDGPPPQLQPQGHGKTKQVVLGNGSTFTWGFNTGTKEYICTAAIPDKVATDPEAHVVVVFEELMITACVPDSIASNSTEIRKILDRVEEQFREAMRNVKQRYGVKS